MKKIIFISLVPLLFLSLKEPEKLKWYSLSEGVELSKSKKKPILIFLYASWCDKCQRMDKKVFNNQEITPLIMQNFIPVKVNVELDTMYFKDDKTIKRKFFLNEVTPGRLQIMVPTTAFYSGQDGSPFIMNGLQDPSDLKENINKFLKK
jgi:thioredoxin-related protein